MLVRVIQSLILIMLLDLCPLLDDQKALIQHEHEGKAEDQREASILYHSWVDYTVAVAVRVLLKRQYSRTGSIIKNLIIRGIDVLSCRMTMRV